MNDQQQRTVLVLAQLFPPSGGPGVQRASKLVKYLPDHGWKPVVVTTSRVVPPRDDDLLTDVAHTHTERTWAPNASESRSLTQRCLRYFSVPDPGVWWIPGAFRTARRLAAETRPEVLFATGGPFSTFCLALLLKRKLGLPLVVDFRDPWTLNPRRYPRRWYVFWRDALERVLERLTLDRADAVVTVNREMQERLLIDPEAKPKLQAISNGFDAEDFQGRPPARPEVLGEPSGASLVYVGSLHPEYKVETRLFEALRLAAARREDPTSLTCHLVGDNQIRVPEDLRDIVKLHPYVGHREAVAAMRTADVLLLLTAGHRHDQTGKLFEYLAARRPLLVVAHQDSAAARRIHDQPAARRVDPDDLDGFARALEELLQASEGLPSAGNNLDLTRKHLAGKMAELFSNVAAAGGASS